MRKITVFILLLLVTLQHRAFAIDEFKTVYQIKYECNTEGETQITQEIEITNLKDDVIATNYALSLKQMQVYDIEATDEHGKMHTDENKNEDTTTIIAYFNDTAVGKGRSNTFTIKYKTKDIATKIGEIYTIKIPKVAGLANIREYNVELVIPHDYGPRIFITPEPQKLKEEAKTNSYFFNRDQLENSGISASFGKYQVLNYNLKYQLKNSSLLTTVQEIALPPDIKERQQVSHKELKPEPRKVYQDEDGNLIAQYVLKPKQEIEVELIGTVRILGRQIDPQNGGNFVSIPKEISKKYTKEQKYWETSAPNIRNLAEKLYDADLNVSQNAYNIYDFIVNALDYDHTVIEKDFVERGGAVSALNADAPAACMEFTDLFIAVARAMKLPARELNGYAINVYQNTALPLSIKTKSGDLLHSWPEYYDPNFGWVPIDPTWGHTSELDFFSKLDSSHFVFAIKGMSSELPLPAGLYRTDDSKSLVSVEISQIDSEEDFRHFAGLYKRLNFNPIQAFLGKRKYYVKNLGGTYLYNLAGENLVPFEVKTVYLDKNLDFLRFEDINGKLKSQSITYLDYNPKKYIVNPFYVVFSVLLGLLLCSYAYYLLILKGYLKKLPSLRLRRPQDQDQPQNQRS